MKKRQSKHLESGEVIDLLRRISEGATSDKTPLSEILRLCMRLGKQLENEEFVKWARSEATGYADWKALPDYRVLDTQVRGDFYGPFGSGVKNAGIPTGVVDREHRDNLFKAHMTQSVAELEKLASANNEDGTLRSSWSADAVAYYQQKEIYSNGLALASAWRVLTQYAVSGILETIRTRVLDFVLQIEGELGVNSAAKEKPIEIDKPESNAIDRIVYTTFYGAQNVAIGNVGPVTQSVINVQPGNLESLKSFLRDAGLTEELIIDLDMALEKDLGAKSQPGPATQSWLGKVMLQIGKGGLSLASNVSGSVIAEALMKFFGIG